MKINIFANNKNPGYTLVASTTVKELLEQKMPTYVMEKVIERITEKLAKSLYPSIRQELIKRKPKMVKQITEQFIAESLDKILKR